MAANDDLEARLRSLTAREARVLVLLLESHASTRDLADVLGSTPGAMQTIRQTIRRKLAVPRNADLAAYVGDVGGLRAAVEHPVQPSRLPAPERRQSLVLRAAVREIDVAIDRVQTKMSALRTLAGEPGTPDRDWILAEAALVERIAAELVETRARALSIARGG